MTWSAWLLLAAGAFAGDTVPDVPITSPSPGVVEQARLPWEAVGFAPAGPERVAIGPQHLAAGPDGLAAVYDPVGQRVIVLRELQIEGAFALGRVDDLAIGADGDLVVTIGRRVHLLDTSGAELDRLDVPAIVPTGVDVEVLGDEIVGVDAFGNLRPIGRIEGRSLQAAEGPALREPRHRARVDAGVVIAAGQAVQVDGALKASARMLDGGGTTWVIVDAVVADAPIAVDRWAVAGDTRVELPVDERLYAPFGDLAVDADGRLLVLDPQADGLHLLRVTP